MELSRIPVAIATTALALVVSAGSPASATTSTSQDLNCDWGQVGSADFTENNSTATWEYWGTWEIKGSGTKDGPHVTIAVAGGTTRLHTESSQSQRIKTIHVQSSGSVQAAGGQQCAAASVSCVDCVPATPLDEVLLPPVPIDLTLDLEPVLEAVDGTVRPLSELVDSIVCQVFQALWPGVPEAVYIDGQGDVYVLGELFWDCPPYVNA